MPPSDQLLLDNGDELHGTLEGIANDNVSFHTDVGAVNVEVGRIRAILLSSAASETRIASSGMQAWVGFRDGSRLVVDRLQIAAAKFEVTAMGQAFRGAASSIVFLQPVGGRAVYLSDVAPLEHHQRPFLDSAGGHAAKAIRWPCRNDRNVAGGRLRCNGRVYLKGIGVHSAAQLVYDISPRPLREGQGVSAVDGRAASPTRFEAEIAIDDLTAGQGSVQFRVSVDGQQKYASPIVRGGHAPLPVSVDIRGGKRLELTVDYADNADVQDHANWLNARVEY